MNYEKIKQELPQIIEIVSGVPEPFKEKCFDVLLNALLAEEVHRKPTPPDTDSQNGARQIPPPSDKIPTPAVVRAFMQRNNISESELSKILLHDSGEVYFVREPDTKVNAQGQIEWSLLLSLKKAVLTNEFSVDPEDVRSICKDKGFYDQSNFAANFKKTENASLFKGLMAPQGEPQTLTADGQIALATLIKSLANRV